VAFEACHSRAYRTLPLRVGKRCNLASQSVRVLSVVHVYSLKLGVVAGVGVGVGAAPEKHGGRDCY
jgi:hypothetical protein